MVLCYDSSSKLVKSACGFQPIKADTKDAGTQTSSSSRVSSRDPRISWTGYGGGGPQASQTPTILPWGCSLKRKAPVMEGPGAKDPVMQSTSIRCFTFLECLYPTQPLLHGLLTSLQALHTFGALVWLILFHSYNLLFNEASWSSLPKLKVISHCLSVFPLLASDSLFF